MMNSNAAVKPALAETDRNVFFTMPSSEVVYSRQVFILGFCPAVT
jgi:hypothetical protein